MSNPSKKPSEAGKDAPAAHPSQAEGERKTKSGAPDDKLKGKDPGPTKRPSQAEGERDA